MWELAEDKGICNFCGHPVFNHEDATLIKRRNDHETILAHKKCYEQRKETDNDK